MTSTITDSDYTSSDDDEYTHSTLKLPNCTLPDFLNTPHKWRVWAFRTNTLSLWRDLMLKIESYSPLYLSDEEVDIVTRRMAEDVLFIHGLTRFFPTDMCDACGVTHSDSVSSKFIFS